MYIYVPSIKTNSFPLDFLFLCLSSFFHPALPSAVASALTKCLPHCSLLHHVPLIVMESGGVETAANYHIALLFISCCDVGLNV